MHRWLVILLLNTALLQGAPVKELPWSFLPLKEQTLPPVQQNDWPQQRLDHFILAGIEAQKLKPAAPAVDRVLLRRLYFDLIGLPPTPEQLADFRKRAVVNRQSAIKTEINTLLASPHYGERWARHWLDLARYTDKTASWLNSTASAWRYRDWVVGALNRDLPYNDFVKKQLANDLIKGGNPKDNAALGFLGLSPTYWKELQLPPEIIKTTVADEWEERMDAVGRTFLGLTLGCARCHDHKFEPVTQADYYAIAGVFASVRIAERPMVSPELWVPVTKARERVADQHCTGHHSPEQSAHVSSAASSGSKVAKSIRLSRLVTIACTVWVPCLRKYFFPAVNGRGFIQHTRPANSALCPGKGSRPTMVSPRLMSRSSSKRSVTDCGQKASSSSPS